MDDIISLPPENTSSHFIEKNSIELKALNTCEVEQELLSKFCDWVL